jgi:hypothetical protein
VRRPVKEGSKFVFELEFENLHPLELGAVLWSLELGQDMHHRVGYGKPLGLGSVKLRITRLEILDTVERYQSLASNGWTNGFTTGARCIKDFVTAMQAEYGEAFTHLLNELHALLSDPPLKAIHYPRMEEPPTEGGENFRWFVENKRRRTPLSLGLATDEDGFPSRPRRG